MRQIKKTLDGQKQLIGIFILTIVLPSVLLSIFGIRAIRSEKYRQEKQVIVEHRRAIALLTTQVTGQIKNVETLLQSTAQHPSYLRRHYSEIRQQLASQFAQNLLAEQIFVLFHEEQPFFPFLQPAPEKPRDLAPHLTASQQVVFARAQKAEFAHHDYISAITLFRQLYDLIEDKNTRAQMLNHMARNQKKSGQITSAIQSYRRIVEHYPESITSSGHPLTLSAGLQIVDCDQKLGMKNRALNRSLELYARILEGTYILNEEQFHLYAGMIDKIIGDLFKSLPSGESSNESHRRYTELQEAYKKRTAQWQIRRQIEDEILPELLSVILAQGSYSMETTRLSRTIIGKEFLISTVPIPGRSGKNIAGLLGMKWGNEVLVNEFLIPILDDLQLSERAKIRILDPLGNVILGEQDVSADFITVSGEFDDRFPDWKIEVYRSGSGRFVVTAIYRSYYFWTILTLMIILTFGIALIARTMAREREVTKIKSDFVSSVSHELKTPLTSIKALTERLMDDKVKSPDKMKQYFSVIAQDADKLTRLVKNILDFSKIEEGKKEYHFEKTDVVLWLTETVENFCKERTHDNVEILTQFDRDIRALDIDRDELSQCINNLLDNAVKFSKESKSVQVELEKDADFILIRVKDRGIGILKEEQDKIFDKFFQGSQSIQQSMKGTGLGLTLVRHAVTAHGGRIDVESQTGSGTIFTIFLPVGR